MKYKALMLAFLLLLPMGLIAATNHANASHGLPGLYVSPPDTKFFGPCIKSTTFTITVNLWNSNDTTYDIYAFDFTLDWGSIPDISLVSGHYTAPWANFFEIANKTTGTTWHLALTAIPPSTGVIAINAPVLTVTFHVDKDLCWPDSVIGSFLIENAKMSSDGTKVVPIPEIEVDNGTYEQYSVQPNIDLTSTAANATGWIIEKCNSTTFDVEVDLTNVTNVYGFGFLLSFDATHLETDAQKITPKPTFAGPYEKTTVYVGPTTVPGLGAIPAGQIFVMFVRPSEKPGICGATVPVIDIIFHTADIVEQPPTLPQKSISSISIVWAFIMVKCQLSIFGDGPGVQGPGEYDSDSYGGAGGTLGGIFGYTPNWMINNVGLYSGGPPFGPLPFPFFFAMTNKGLIIGAPLTYYFKPSKYDLNLDCVIDVQDLKALLPYYGLDTSAADLPTSYGDLADIPAGSDLVDIFDFVAIAKNFGPVDP
jgi:hypothetical protein